MEVKIGVQQAAREVVLESEDLQKAMEGGVELGAFTSAAPTAVAEGDDLKPGDVVEVPADDPAPEPAAP